MKTIIKRQEAREAFVTALDRADGILEPYTQAASAHNEKYSVRCPRAVHLEAEERLTCSSGLQPGDFIESIILVKTAVHTAGRDC